MLIVHRRRHQDLLCLILCTFFFVAVYVYVALTHQTVLKIFSVNLSLIIELRRKKKASVNDVKA